MLIFLPPLQQMLRSTNLAPEEEGGVRFMCHPAVPLKEHMDFNVSGASLLEGVRWDIDGLFFPRDMNRILQLKNRRVAIS